MALSQLFLNRYTRKWDWLEGEKVYLERNGSIMKKKNSPIAMFNSIWFSYPLYFIWMKYDNGY